MQPTRPPGPFTGPSKTTPTIQRDASGLEWLGDDPVLATVGPETAGGAIRWDEDVSGDADALADLFLGDGELGVPVANVQAAPSQTRAGREAEEQAGAPTSHSAESTVRVEALVLGHLPVLGTAWLGGYANLLAGRLGAPVALAKLRGGYLSLSVVGLDGVPVEPSCEVADAIAYLNSKSVRWLLCTDATEEPTLVREGDPDGVTMLTSADEAAVVGSYQAIKGLLEVEAGRPAWPDRADLTIALAGSTPERARSAGDKLRSAVRTYLGRGVRVEICPQRIGPSASRGVFAGAWEGSIQEFAHLVRAARGTEGRSEAKPHDTDPSREGQWTDVAASKTQASAAPARPAAPPEPPAHHTPAPTRDRALQSSALCTCIDGLTHIAITCPYAPGIELALDAEGSLHLVSGVEALSNLHRARAWAQAHEALMKAAVQGFKNAGSPVCHVVSESPADLRPLIESDVKAHMLVRGVVNGSAFAVGRALN